jgi:hypothetical protein
MPVYLLGRRRPKTCSTSTGPSSTRGTTAAGPRTRRAAEESPGRRRGAAVASHHAGGHRLDCRTDLARRSRPRAPAQAPGQGFTPLPDLPRPTRHPQRDPMTPPNAELATAQNLWALLEERATLYARWRETHSEEDRRAMQASWHIWITSPRSHFGDPALHREAWSTCTPTVLSRDSAQAGDHLEYRGRALAANGSVTAFTACSAAARTQRPRTPTITPTPDRAIPVVEHHPRPTRPPAYTGAVSRWRERWESLLPGGC